jgi:copper homeostasis protein CutC
MLSTRMKRMLLEICVASVEDALAARDGGADRTELNAGLALGGLTPSLGMLKEVRQAVEVPLVAMIRPRPGGFCYSPREFAVLRRDVDAVLEHGADGIVFGILREDGTVDADRCRQVVEQAAGREAVFHRAFDFVPDVSAAISELAHIGIRRVMTSGGQVTALAGAERIASLVQQAADKIEILPAGKINAANAAALIARTGCRQVHASLRTVVAPSFRPALPLDEADLLHLTTHECTSLAAVRALRETLDVLV